MKFPTTIADNGRVLIRIVVVLALLAGTASAEEPERSRAYFGVTAGAFILDGFIGEASVDGGVRLGATRFWVRGRVFAGESDTGDFSSQRYRGVQAGAEIRTHGRPFQGVAGFDVGAAHVRDFSEDVPNGAAWELAMSAHLGLDVRLGEHAVFRVMVKGAEDHPFLPLLTAGAAVVF